jgi:hypothetical protein
MENQILDSKMVQEQFQIPLNIENIMRLWKSYSEKCGNEWKTFTEYHVKKCFHLYFDD